MRFVMQVSFPIDPFNKFVADGTAGQKLARILEELRPEAAYFTATNGRRGGYFIVNIEKTSEMPRLAEPFFLTLNAEVQFLPTMTPDDLQKAGLEELGRKWR